MHPYKLPNLYIPGAGKSGTSTLHELLNTHPEICMSNIKEPHYWTRSNYDEVKDILLSRYETLFEDKNCKYFGESSTCYIAFPEFKVRMEPFYTKSPKFIFLLRNPIDRIYSHYWWLKGMGSEELSFKEAVLSDYDVAPAEKNRLPEGNFKTYFQFGLYGKWIQKFQETYGKENIHIITTESLKSNKLETLNSCFNFLNLENLDSLPDTLKNKTTLLKFPKVYKTTKKILFGDTLLKKTIKSLIPLKYRSPLKNKIHQSVFSLTSTNQEYPQLSSEDRLWLKSLYEEDVVLLKNITGKTFEDWEDFN
ncbi:sulfotransferase domain-containing protein [Planktosalinus lacus]|uniref:Sulfotransferase domain-containing protein n=1 Tax=Planktosalinus lacus TaxID=1526573 RepID=A0A8J2V8V4_9FLAO|nr:sulfotransferase domain-containing protein [Planktosalinus lacus]GGD85452.1 hypothetical protein GCM10011312_06860 [Planktosalinus lacus]